MLSHILLMNRTSSYRNQQMRILLTLKPSSHLAIVKIFDRLHRTWVSVIVRRLLPIIEDGYWWHRSLSFANKTVNRKLTATTKKREKTFPNKNRDLQEHTHIILQGNFMILVGIPKLFTDMDKKQKGENNFHLLVITAISIVWRISGAFSKHLLGCFYL